MASETIRSHLLKHQPLALLAQSHPYDPVFQERPLNSQLFQRLPLRFRLKKEVVHFHLLPQMPPNNVKLSLEAQLLPPNYYRAPSDRSFAALQPQSSNL